jgi:hypothetical protein
VTDILDASGTRPVILKEAGINQLIMRLLAMDFKSEAISLNNFQPTDTEVNMGSRVIRSISLVNTDAIDLPPEVGTYIELNEKDTSKGSR